ncbi:MAG: SGNH/GDSL hydrolase family protein [Cyanobacteria bacterium J06606_4]
MRKTLLAMGIAIASCIIPASAKAASFEALNIFGDSLVDTGNLFTLTSAFADQGIPALPPSPPYAQKNSNGPIWIDNVGQSLGLSPTLVTDLQLDPTTPAPTQGINYAFAGALSSDIHILDSVAPPLADLLPGFQEQVETATAIATNIPINPNALNVVWVGANDYNEAFFSPESLGGLTLEALPNAVTDNVINGLTQLHSLGAREFLVPNIPPIEEAPVANFLDAQAQQDISSILEQLVGAHNALLSAKLDAFEQSKPDTNIIRLDINTLIEDIVADPNAFGLANVTDTCLTNFQPGFLFEGICDNPDEFLFWDDVHPTTAAYQIVSDFALEAISEGKTPASVPEPGSLMALFFSFVIGTGALAKRSTSKAAVVGD